MKILKEKEVKITEFKTSSGATAYKVSIPLTKDMMWLKYPKKLKVRYIEDDSENPKIELIPIYDE